ncbi:MAG: AMP-binding protein [Parachlamydiaceae bacterium]|nr:AMP-binding protein [Parachlamydiaceae bacterium]
MNLFKFVEYGDRVAIIEGDISRIISFQELENATLQFANSFEKSKFLCFFFISSTIDCMIAYLSLINLGHTIALFEANMHPELKEHLINLYHPQFVIDSLAPPTDTPSYIKEQAYQPFHTTLPSLFVWKYAFPHMSPALYPKLQLLLSTSGTTGSPKLIRLSSTNIISNAKSIVEYLQISGKDRAMASLPFHYSYGLSILHTHLLVGASIVLTQRSIIQEQFWQLFDQFACTSLAGVPHTYQLLERLGLDQLHCPSLKTLMQAGGKMSPALTTKYHSIMEKRHGRFFTMYGQTEATARIAYLPPDYLPAKAGAIGIAIPRGKLHLFNGEQEVIDPFCEGELVYSGPNVMLGYANTPDDLALGDQLNGELRTGDLGYFDNEGIYYITARLKRFSKVYGLRINLDDIEQAASKFGHIIATSNDNVIKLYYEKNIIINITACITSLAAKYHLSQSTFECIGLNRFPLTASGKIDYTKL